MCLRGFGSEGRENDGSDLWRGAMTGSLNNPSTDRFERSPGYLLNFVSNALPSWVPSGLREIWCRDIPGTY